MEVRIQQDAKSVCMKRGDGAMSAGEVLEEELCLLPEGCLSHCLVCVVKARRETKKRRVVSSCGGVV